MRRTIRGEIERREIGREREEKGETVIGREALY